MNLHPLRTTPSAHPSDPPVTGPRDLALELLPGDWAVGALGDQFRTLLGSCISVVLTDPRRTVGAMCHIVHAGAPPDDDPDNTAYGLAAMEAMFTGLQRMGIQPQLCEAWIYGGGNMFPELFGHLHVGASNADWVRAFLQRQGITVLDEQVGGNGYRKVSWSVGAHMPQVEFITRTDVQHAG